MNGSIFLLSAVFFLSILSVNTMHAQTSSFHFGQLDSLNAIEKRKVVVFIHTDWCKYCHQMKNTTFKNEDVTRLLGDRFYFISMDAESKRDIHYNGHTFKYQPTGEDTGVHGLAEQLGTINGKMNYPTISILNEKNEIVFQYASFMHSDELLAVLKEALKE